MNQVLQKWIADFCAQHGGTIEIVPEICEQTTEPIEYHGRHSNKFNLCLLWRCPTCKTKAGGEVSTYVDARLHKCNAEHEWMLRLTGRYMIERQTKLLSEIKHLVADDDAALIHAEINRRADG